MIEKVSKKIKYNDDIIVINKNEEKNKRKDSYINQQNYPSKKIMLFPSTNNEINKEYYFSKLNTIQNLDNEEKKLKMSLILNKNANILSTQILKNTKSSKYIFIDKDSSIYRMGL